MNAARLHLLEHRVMELEDAIRRHRDERGDDRCWMDDERLYAVLPEGYTPPARDSSVELENCKRFIACRQNSKTEYISPQRRIEELEAVLQHFASSSNWAAPKASDQYPNLVFLGSEDPRQIASHVLGK